MLKQQKRGRKSKGFISLEDAVYDWKTDTIKRKKGVEETETEVSAKEKDAEFLENVDIYTEFWLGLVFVAVVLYSYITTGKLASDMTALLVSGL